MLRYVQVLSPVGLDPVDVDDVWSAQAANRVFEGLYSFGEGTDLVPQLATGPPEQAGSKTTYRVKLRTDAAFHNSDAVTSEDVKYSFEAPVREEAPTKWALEPIREIRTPDDHTVEFHLEYPYPAFEYALTQPIVPKEARASNPEEFASSPIGSGPYEASIVKKNKYTVLEAWDDYWGEADPEIETVKFVGNHSGLARTTSLRSEQNEIVERIEPKLWSVTEGMPDTQVQVAKSLHYFYVGFNCNDGPTEDPKVRKAIDYLVDMDDLVEHFVAPEEKREEPKNFVESGEGDDTPWRQFSPVPEQLAQEWKFPLDRWREVPRDKNTDEAKRLLEEAGVKSWQPTIAVPKDMLREKFADAIVHELSNIGFKRARTEKYHWETYREKLRSGSATEYNMFVGSWAGWPDPDSFLYPLLHENMEGLTNFTFYQNQSVMDHIRRARETAERTKRKTEYEKAISTLLRDRPHLPAFTLHNTFGVDSSVKGFEPHPISSVNPRLVSPQGSVSLSK
jgi:peptide/nickel transport system substrate-binding protein